MEFKLKYLNLFKAFNGWIESRIKPRLHNKRSYYINKTLEKFKNAYDPDEKTLIDFKSKLELEADRVYTFTDRAIIRSQLQRAGIAFLVTLAAGEATVLVGGLATGAAFTILPFIAPFVGASVAWFVTVATIPIVYNQRVKGGFDAVYVIFEKSYQAELQQKLEKNNVNQLSIHDQSLSQPVSENELVKIQKVLDEIQQSLKVLTDEKNTANENKPVKSEVMTNVAAKISDISFLNKKTNSIEMETTIDDKHYCKTI